MNYIQDYKDRKTKVLSILKECSDFFIEIGKPEIASSLSNLYEQTQNNKFSIVVVGQFSAGKSTMLNALMGEKYLPSFSKETTATVNFLRSVDQSPTGKEMIVVNYKDGSKKELDEVSLDEVEKYVSTNGENVAQTISSVEIFLEGSKFLNDGVSLVDSPGLNGLKEGHAEITHQQIMQSHASIFVFTACQPGTKTDFESLKKLKDKCPSVIIVLNQIDHINHDEQTEESVVEELKRNYQSFFPGDNLPEIWPIAAYPALVKRSKADLKYNNTVCEQAQKEKLYKESHIEEFEDRLWRYLTEGEKAKQELLSPIQLVKASINEEKVAYNHQLELLDGEVNIQETLERKDALQREIEALDQNVSAKRSQIKNEVFDMITDAKDAIKSETRSVGQRYIDKIGIESEIDELGENHQQYLSRLNADYQQKYEEVMTDLVKTFKKIVRGQYDSLTSAAEERINSIRVEGDGLPAPNVKIDSSVFELDIDLGSYYEDRINLLDELDNIENSVDNNDIKIVRAKVSEKRREEQKKRLFDELKRLREERSSMGSRPGVKTRIITTEKRSWGIGGCLKWLWNGNPPKQVTTYVDDTSAQEEYDSRCAELNNEIECVRSKYDSQIQNLKDEFTLEELQVEGKHLERKREQLEKKLQRLEERKESEMASQKKKRFVAARNHLLDCIERINDGSRKALLTSLDQQEDFLIGEVERIVKENMGVTMERKLAELQECQDIIDANADEKEQLRSQIGVWLQKLDEFNVRIDEIEDELDFESDTIKVEN